MKEPLMYRPRIYTASKIHHAPLWHRIRQLYHDRVILTARWIELGQGKTQLLDHASGAWTPSEQILHWIQDIQDVQNSDYLLAYNEAGDALSGTLVEVGAAIASCKIVLAVGFQDPSHSWTAHPLVLKFPSVTQALNFVITGHEIPGDDYLEERF